MSKRANSIADRLGSLFSETAKIQAQLTAATGEIEADLTAAKDRLASVSSAPVGREEVSRRIRAYAVDAAEEARHASGVIDFARLNYAPAYAHDLSRMDPRHIFGFHVLVGDLEAIVEKLTDAALASFSAPPISSAERERETNALNAEIADLERMRERIARQAAAHGINIPRSEFADPAVLLAPDSEL
ncbi:hypothetical protein [Rhizobium lentis]|uniref:hypothetical protein n=1 Tax=Rhizobium lentis TaxID=1138194 RepID=UPI001C837CE1|nr:hypothetical protein [Rhizobium lentis]MBX5144964.1 hypothetical protein [Rhizobium lentis]